MLQVADSAQARHGESVRGRPGYYGQPVVKTAGLDMGNSSLLFRWRSRAECRRSSRGRCDFHHVDVAAPLYWLAAIGAGSRQFC